MLRIRVCAARDGVVHEAWLELPDGSSAGQAAAASGLAPAGWNGALAVHGRQVTADHVLREGDRVELLQPLQVEPRARRRARAQRPR